MKEIYEEFSKIVGSEFVSDQPEEKYIYSMDPGTMTPREPDVVVMPNCTEEVRQIILLANQHRIPVVPLGAGLVLSGLSRALFWI
jgi:FAD/FMN-containing dehydrogenase